MHLRFWGSRVARRQCRKHKSFLNKPFYLVFGDFRCTCQNQIESIGKVQGHIGIQQLVGNKTSAFDSQENAAPILSHPPLRQSRDRDIFSQRGRRYGRDTASQRTGLSASGQGAGPGFGGLPRAFPAVPGGLSRVPSGRHLQRGLQRHLHGLPGVRPAPVRRKPCPTKKSFR